MAILSFMTTNDKIIRTALRIVLETELEQYKLEKKLPVEIFEEFGVSHGAARIDFALINEVMHGYEIKSDRDTLDRLPEQMKEYNDVFDKMTLVVGKRHLYHAIHVVPNWWGIMLAKNDINTKVVFQEIRADRDNQKQDQVSIARLLWRKEALRILEEKNVARGFRSQTRSIIYEKLVDVIDTEALKERVRNTLLVSRRDRRPDVMLALCGD